MENIPKPPTPESTSETKESKKSKKKKAENLGSFLIDPKNKAEKTDEEKPSFFGKKEKTDSQSDHKPTDGETSKATDEERNEADDSAEADAPLEQLSPAERQEALEAIVSESAEANSELPVTDAEDAIVTAAVEQFHAEIIENHKSLEEAQATLAEALGVPISSENEPEASERTAEDVQEGGQEENNEEDSVPKQEAETVVGEIANDAENEVENEDPLTTGGGGQPPRGYNAIPYGAPGAGNPNVAPVATPAPTERIVDRRRVRSDLLVGAVVGYFVGKRRGRIKTEQKLVPVQKKLEKEIGGLRDEVRDKEDKIRAAARKQARAGVPMQQPRHTAENSGKPNAENINSKTNPTAETGLAAALVQPKVERPVTASKGSDEKLSAATEFERKAAEALIIDQKRARKEQEAPTHIGKMIITAEAVAKSLSKPERDTPAVVGTSEKSIEKKVETMNRAELMRLSEKIIVDGSSLRQIYESKLVGEKGLRRLVREHLKGGDIKKVLRKEIVQREIDFERDPFMRDNAGPTAGEKRETGSGKATTLKQMLQAVETANESSSEEVAFLKARANHEQKQQSKVSQKRKIMDISLITTIALLSSFVLILMLEHR